MLKEALEFLVGLGQKAQTPYHIPIEDKRAAHFLIGTEDVPVPVAPAPRDHAVGTLDEIIALAKRFAEGEVATNGTDAEPVVWYDADRVVLVIDDTGHRLDKATLTLEKSDVFLTVRKLADKPTWMSQKEFIRLLRVDLGGTLNPDILLNVVRKAKFEQGATTDGHIAHAKESIGRSIRAEVATSGGTIPESVFLQVTVYSTSGETDRYPLACAVEVEPEQVNAPFRLVPFPDEIERVSALAVASIGGRLKAGLGDGCPCYHGQP